MVSSCFWEGVGSYLNIEIYYYKEQGYTYLSNPYQTRSDSWISLNGESFPMVYTEFLTNLTVIHTKIMVRNILNAE